MADHDDHEQPQTAPLREPEVFPTPPKTVEDPRLLFIIRAAVLVMCVLFFIAAYFTRNLPVIDVPFLRILTLGGLLILLPVAYLWRSWGVANTDEFTLAYFFGRALKELKPGPHFLPWKLVQLRKIPRTRRQFQAPAETEKIFYGSDEEDLPAGMQRALRIVSGKPGPDETGPLAIQMTLEITWYVQYQVLPGKLLQFQSIVGSYENAEKMMRDTGDALINEFVSTHSVDGIISGLAAFNRNFDDKMRALTNQWYMEVYEAKVLPINPGKTVSEELRNVPAANLRAAQIRTTAEAERFRLEQEGAGKAKAEADLLEAQATGRKQFLEGEAAGLKAKIEALGVSGEDVLAAEVASDAFKHADTIIAGGSGIADLVSGIKAVSSTLTRNSKNKPEDGGAA